MTIRNRVDPVRMGEEIFYRIFHHIFHDEGARKYFEFSQINFFNNTQGLPGWNLWFQKKTRVFQLILLDAQEVINTSSSFHFNSFEKTHVEGRFLIRYFPGIEEPTLDNFSCAETIARYSPIFDDTGTPTLEGQEEMDETYFVVGYLDFRTHTGRDFVELECIAPNQWKNIQTDGLYLRNNENKQFQAVKPGGVDRCVHGWDLAFFLFDKLISGFGYTFKTEPCASIFAQKKGAQFEIDKNNNCTEKKDPEIDLYHLIAGFKTNLSHSISCCPGVKNDGGITDAFIHTITQRMIKQGFKISDVWTGHEKQNHTVMRQEWWNSRHIQFASVTETEMQHCCYHDH